MIYLLFKLRRRDKPSLQIGEQPERKRDQYEREYEFPHLS